MDKVYELPLIHHKVLNWAAMKHSRKITESDGMYLKAAKELVGKGYLTVPWPDTFRLTAEGRAMLTSMGSI